MQPPDNLYRQLKYHARMRKWWLVYAFRALDRDFREIMRKDAADRWEAYENSHRTGMKVMAKEFHLTRYFSVIAGWRW